MARMEPEHITGRKPERADAVEAAPRALNRVVERAPSTRGERKGVALWRTKPKSKWYTVGQLHPGNRQQRRICRLDGHRRHLTKAHRVRHSLPHAQALLYAGRPPAGHIGS